MVVSRFYGAEDWSYDGAEGIMAFIHALMNGNDPGSGVGEFSKFGVNLLGPKIPRILINYNILMQNNLFGGYPQPKDVVPLIIFAAIFAMLMIVHLIIYIMNLTRNHYFHFNLFWSFYCMIKVIGFVTRITWSYDSININMALANEVLLVVASVLVVPSNLILAQRLFTWRHPVGGSRKSFTNIMLVLYILVAAVLTMTIVASCVPYSYNLSVRTFWNYKICVMVASVLTILYSLTSIILLGLAFFFKPTRKDENLYTYQPWWIESFHPLYFVKKGAKLEAEESFMKRNHNHRHAVRVIAATHHHYNMVEGLTNQRGTLEHNKSILIITISTIFLFISAIGRAIVVFQSNTVMNAGPAASPIFMYICWGVFETIINLLFIIGRVDLRFYKPDKLPKKVRNIITAEQSVNTSPIQSDDDSYIYDNYSIDQPEYELKPHEHSTDDNTPNLTMIEKKQNSSYGYSTDTTKNDNDSEFHF